MPVESSIFLCWDSNDSLLFENVCKVSLEKNVQFERGLELLFLTLERILF